jgi:hypothetical protein
MKNSVRQSYTYQLSLPKLDRKKSLEVYMDNQLKKVGTDQFYLDKKQELDYLLAQNPKLTAIETVKALVDQNKGNLDDVNTLLSSLTPEIRKEVYESVTTKKIDPNSSTDNSLNSVTTKKVDPNSSTDNSLNEEILKKLKQDKGYSEFGLFLIPFQDVLGGNIKAIVALCIASFIDVVSLIFGISLNKKATDENINAKFKNLSRNIKELLKNSLPNLIKEIGHTIYLFIASFGSLINGILKGFILLRVRALQVFHYTPYTIKIKGDRHEFLHNIWESIEFSWEEDTKMNLLNYTKLMTLAQYNPSYRVGYKKIIITMRNLQWLTISEKISSDSQEYSSEDKKLSINKYDELDKWYHSEYCKQFGPEKNSMLDADDYNHIIRLPENKGEEWGERSRWWLKRQFRKLKFAIRQIFTG